MGDAVFKLFAFLGINTSEYDEGLDESEKKGSNFGTGIKKAAAAVGTAIAGATTAVVGFSAKAVQAGMSFDTSMSQVAATMGLTTDEIKDLRDYAQKMGSTTAFSASQAADALNYMALAGYDADKSMSMLPNVLNLAAAGSIDLATASDMVTDAQSALGLSMEQTTTMVDQMAMASSKSNTSVAQLGDAILTIGATASKMKGGTTELTTVLGVLADNGIKGAEGGTHLRNILLSLTNPTDQAVDSLKALGVSVYDDEGNMRSMVDIIGDLQTATADMSEEAKNSAIGSIFQKADMASVNALLNTQKERYDELTDYIDSAQGSAAKMADTQLDNLAGDVTLFKSALEGAQIALSDELSPSLRQFVQLGSQGLSDITEAFKKDGLQGAFSALGTWISTALDKVVEFLPDAVEAGMNLLGALIDGMIDNADKIIGAAEKIITILTTKLLDPARAKKMTQASIDIIVKLMNGITQALPVIIPAIAEVITTIVTTLTQPENLSALIQGALMLIMALAEGLIKAIPELIRIIPEITVNVTMALIENFPLILQTVLELIGALAIGILEALAALMGTSLDEVGEGLAYGFEQLKAWAKGLLKWLSDGANLILDNIKAFMDNPKEYIRNALSNIKSFFINTFNNVKEKVVSVFEALKTLIPTAIDNIKKAISDGLEKVKQKFTDIFEGLKSAAGKAFDVIKNIFSGKWELPKIKVPHFKIEGKFNFDPTNFSVPKIKVDWYRKAYDDAYLLNGATIFGSMNGKLLGGGEGSGSELVVGTNKLMRMIKSAAGGPKVVNIYVQGAEGQDIRELAKEVAREFQNLIDDEESVYA